MVSKKTIYFLAAWSYWSLKKLEVLERGVLIPQNIVAS